MLLDLEIDRYAGQLKTRKHGEQTQIWCLIRQKWLILQPEEFVRQLLLIYFIDHLKVNKSRISVEKGIKVNDLQKRCDILIYDMNLKPWMLIECKAPSVKLSQSVFRQIATYNMPLQVPLIMVCNGPQAYCCAIDFEHSTFSFLKKMPTFWSE